MCVQELLDEKEAPGAVVLDYFVLGGCSFYAPDRIMEDGSFVYKIGVRTPYPERTRTRRDCGCPKGRCHRIFHRLPHRLRAFFLMS